MGLAEYAAMQRHWADHPPVHLMAAAWLGIKPRARRRPAGDTGDMAALVAMFGGAPGRQTTIR